MIHTKEVIKLKEAVWVGPDPAGGVRPHGGRGGPCTEGRLQGEAAGGEPWPARRKQLWDNTLLPFKPQRSWCLVRAADSSVLAWRIPWTEEPGGLQSTGSQRVRQIEHARISFSPIREENPKENRQTICITESLC